MLFPYSSIGSSELALCVIDLGNAFISQGSGILDCVFIVLWGMSARSVSRGSFPPSWPFILSFIIFGTNPTFWCLTYWSFRKLRANPLPAFTPEWHPVCASAGSWFLREALPSHLIWGGFYISSRDWIRGHWQILVTADVASSFALRSFLLTAGCIFPLDRWKDGTGPLSCSPSEPVYGRQGSPSSCITFEMLLLKQLIESFFGGNT